MSKNIVVLTGAGISAESGIKTFRGADGLWEGHRVEDVATPEGFQRNPALVYEFYNHRRRQLLDENVKPNAAHKALAQLEAEHDGNVLVVTQNIDNLHERGGSKEVLHMHGELLKARCLKCHEISDTNIDFSGETECQVCFVSGGLRPHIVWFGEMPLYMPEIADALQDCDIFAAIGTSGNVYPAAGFVQEARFAGAETYELNLEPSQVNAMFDHHIHGPATEVVTAWVGTVLC